MHSALPLTMTHGTLVHNLNFKQSKLTHVFLISGTDDYCANT